ncbi:MAG: MFS transporter [Rikenellaceae bacterium]|nr:MFS transporter [Rikenellaceae bacterium]
MKKSLLALAFGTLALGISEYVMMGILPFVAEDLAVTIVQSGHLISAYAIGVCIGAPLTVIVARKQPLKTILYGLVGMIVLGNLLMAIAPGYGLALGARFISGLPHGAYFGVGSIVAERVADKGKTTAAVAAMIAGMTFANLIGVPLGTLVGNLLSWRLIFWIVGLIGILAILFIRSWIPYIQPLPNTGIKGQFAFLKRPQPWFLLFATTVANTGIFCWYSYVSPSMTELSGFTPQQLTWIMVLAGFGMVIGNFTGGKLSDRFTPLKFDIVAQWLGGVVLLGIFLLGAISGLALILLFCCTMVLFSRSAPEQLLILQQSRGGELMGASLIQVAFNLGNAFGAFLGGVPLTRGYGYEYSAAIGMPFAVCGFILMWIFSRRYGSGGNILPSELTAKGYTGD